MSYARLLVGLISLGLGATIIVRLLRFGMHQELLSGLFLGGLLILLGAYRLYHFVRAWNRA